MNYKNWSVGVVVTNPSKTFFYLQQKDETYFIEEYRLKYCFFGGSIEENENENDALKRELEEELSMNLAEKITRKITRLFDTYFINIQNVPYKHTLYESIISDDELIALSKIIPKEGKKGALLTREELKNIPIFTDLEEARNNYFKILM